MIKNLKIYLSVILILFIMIYSVNFVRLQNVFGQEVSESTISNISVDLESESNVKVKKDEATTLKYKVTPNIYNTSINEAVFLVDTSAKMKNPDNGGTRDRVAYAQDLIKNIKDMVNKSDGKIKLKAGVLGYSDKLYTFSTYNISDSENTDLSNIKLYDMNTSDGSRLDDRASAIPNTIYNTNSSSRNITPALIQADKLLNGSISSFDNMKKAIIILSCGENQIDYSDNKIKDIIKKGYKIITIDISNSTDTERGTYDENKLKEMTSRLGNNTSFKTLELTGKDANLSNDQQKLLSSSSNFYFKVFPIAMNNNEYNYSQNKLYSSAMEGAVYGSINVNSDNFKVDNVKMTFDTGGNFRIGNTAVVEYDGHREEIRINSLEGNKVEIDISKFIEYNVGSNGFEPTINSFNVSFDVTPLEDGGTFAKDSEGNDLSNLSYTENIDGNVVNRKTGIETPKINVNDFNASIGIQLEKPKPKLVSNAKVGDSINVKYSVKVTPSDEQIKLIAPQPIDEVMFLIDLSNNMNSQARATYAINGLCNKIVDQNLLNDKSIKMGIIGMGNNSELVRGDDNTEKDNNLNLDYTNNNLLNRNIQKEKSAFEGRIKKLDTKNDVIKPNVMSSLQKADEIFENEGKKTDTKAIVLVVSQEFDYDESVINNIKNKGYKVIIMDISYDQTSEKYLAQADLNTLYANLGGYGENYMNGEYQTTGADRMYNFSDNDCQKIAEKLLIGVGDKPHKLTNLNFNFDLGRGFAIDTDKAITVNNVTASFDPKVNNNLSENKYALKLPDIDFQGKIIEPPNADHPGKIKISYTPSINGQTIPNGIIPVEFNIKFIEDTGENPIVFGTKDTEKNNNYFSYNDVYGEEVIIKPIDTPQVRIMVIKHGLYLNQNNKKIDENPTQNFAYGSVVTMAAEFNAESAGTAQLTLDNKLVIDGKPSIVGKIRVYTNNNPTPSEYSYSDKISFASGDILVIYSVKIPNISSSEALENTITVDGIPKSATIYASGELPDLF